MNADDFQRELAEKGGYSTDLSAKKVFCDNLFGWMDLWFYWRSFQVVCSAAYIAKRGHYNDKEWARHSFGVLQAIERCGGQVKVSGYENLTLNPSPCVYVANHMSIIETFLLPVMLVPFNHLTIVVKESLLDYPVFRHVMRGVNPISVGRKDPRVDFKTIIDGGCASLKRGESVLVFPQSTRSLDFDPKSFNSIGVKLAKKSGMDLIPIAVKTDFLQIGKILRDFGPVDREKVIHLEFGQRISLQGSGREEHERILEFIDSRIDKWRKEEQSDT